MEVIISREEGRKEAKKRDKEKEKERKGGCNFMKHHKISRLLI